MPRPHRLDVPDTWHHVTNRGHNRKDIVRDEQDCKSLAALLGDVTGKGGIEVHSFSFMSNHLHLLVYAPTGGLSLAMKHVMGMYAQRFNTKYDHDGSLWKGRFFSLVVRREAHLMELPRYIDNNPVKAGIVNDPADYRWSSHRSLLGMEAPASFLSTNVIVPQWFGGSASAYRAFVRRDESDLSQQIGKVIEGDARFGDLETALSDGVVALPNELVALIRSIEAFICTELAVDPAQLRLHTRGHRNVAKAAAVTLAYQASGASASAIAHHFGMGSRSSVRSTVRRFEADASTDPELDRILDIGMKRFDREAA